MLYVVHVEWRKSKMLGLSFFKIVRAVGKSRFAVERVEDGRRPRRKR